MPAVMHIDLNSCFASAEQQANPLIRGKPVVVAAYTTPRGCIIAPSVEAKQLGIKLGMRVRDAQAIYPQVVVLPPDPPKYRDIHHKFKKIFQSYSPKVFPKSIDEAVIDFNHTPALKQGLVAVGREIKQRLKQEVGVWIRCNVGIGTNRFLAKLAASLHKPDGLDVITFKNLKQVYRQVTLTDLNGINKRFEARLNSYGIFTPLQFLNAGIDLLKKQVFKSICGFHWHLRLRGWEVDQVEFSRKSFGQTYSLPVHTADPKDLAQLLMKLCEKMGRRLRHAGFLAQGIHVACLYSDHSFWHQSKKFRTVLSTTQELYIKALLLLNHQPVRKKIANLSVSCFDLIPDSSRQLDLFESEFTKRRSLFKACDCVNDRFGEFVAIPARMMNLKDKVIDRIAFGGVREL